MHWKLPCGLRNSTNWINAGKPAILALMSIVMLTPYGVRSFGPSIRSFDTRARRMWSEARKGYESVRLLYEIKNQIEGQAQGPAYANKPGPALSAASVTPGSEHRVARKSNPILARRIQHEEPRSAGQPQEGIREPRLKAAACKLEPRFSGLPQSGADFDLPAIARHPRSPRIEVIMNTAAVQEALARACAFRAISSEGASASICLTSPRVKGPPTPLTKGTFRLRIANRMPHPPYSSL